MTDWIALAVASMFRDRGLFPEIRYGSRQRCQALDTVPREFEHPTREESHVDDDHDAGRERHPHRYRDGDEIVLEPGTTWVTLVPQDTYEFSVDQASRGLVLGTDE